MIENSMKIAKLKIENCLDCRWRPQKTGKAPRTVNSKQEEFFEKRGE